ncbi:MAG: hypothetical protein HOP19_02140, partial [Acidobacteria bacterium]|nr:hypothetical protein [Acidobacteriota bacterium]
MPCNESPLHFIQSDKSHFYEVDIPITKGYEFAGYRFAPNLRLLWRDGEPLALTDRISRMLSYLIEQRGRIVSQNELLEALWQDTHVADANVRVTMNRLRTLLREEENATPLILTIPKQGYRFVADVAVRLPETAASVAAKTLGEIAPQEKLYAEQLFLRGRQLIESHEPHAFEKGLHFLREAVRLNPQMIEAWVGIANAYTYLGTFQINSPHNVFPQAEQALQKARALDADEPILLAARANYLLMSQWDAAESGHLLEQALQRLPQNATIEYQAGLHALMTADSTRAIECLRRSMALEPLFFPPVLALAQAQAQAGEVTAAFTTLQKLLVLEEPLNFAHYDLSRLYLNEAKLDEALACAERA